EVAADLAEVVDLAVEDDDVRAEMHGLRAALTEVDHGQAPVSQAHVRVGEDALAVGAAVLQGACHACDEFRLVRRDACDAAHAMNSPPRARTGRRTHRPRRPNSSIRLWRGCGGRARGVNRGHGYTCGFS